MNIRSTRVKQNVFFETYCNERALKAFAICAMSRQSIQQNGVFEHRSTSRTAQWDVEFNNFFRWSPKNRLRPFYGSDERNLSDLIIDWLIACSGKKPDSCVNILVEIEITSCLAQYLPTQCKPPYTHKHIRCSKDRSLDTVVLFLPTFWTVESAVLGMFSLSILINNRLAGWQWLFVGFVFEFINVIWNSTWW